MSNLDRLDASLQWKIIRFALLTLRHQKQSYESVGLLFLYSQKMLVFYCEYKKQGRVARKITKIGRNPAEQKRCLLQSNN